MIESTPLLCASNLHFSYPHEAPVLRGIDLTIRPGELLTLLGPNGAGKSTLLNCLMGFLTPQSGTITLSGRDIRTMNVREVSRHIAYVAQTPSCSFQHVVRDYIAMGRAPYLKLFEKPSPSDYALVDACIARMGIENLAHKIYTQLSGGERQLVNVCRAIVQKPQIILFDEPTSALDYGNQIKVLRMVKELSRQGFSILITTHNPDHPILLNGTVCVLSREGELRCGSPEEIMTEEYMNQIYQAKLKIKYLEEERRMICISESL